ncbi:biopolymer transporter ExbD [candidate division KSB1 bacterium]|nr:biopolymer transporter ExbD [candidate division KSB1 bacterium]NIR71825.1 biopolymer transporter ExbD [candidate division KSB1 bacterium]NIS25341.1 biopolymer transporter ExbD [candidate division KSB1 bacterium]NIT71811.1 biopolymer transporter ExbD [candidate division KSB1 bacterium]NIU25549.1 biopolymer transporter ExbD [candidate division KSB1 bacterium]
MQFQAKQKRRKVFINITSLIDVLFLLLIFFMISSTFLEQPGIKLELPKAESAVVTEQKEYVLFINKEGKLYLNQDEVLTENLEERLTEALPNMKDGALILKADQDATHGIVVRVMDIAKETGVKKLIIGTKLDDKE